MRTIAKLAALAALGLAASCGGTGVTADIGGQGGEGSPLAPGGVTLWRSDAGLRVEVRVPTPEPGTYEYPAAELVPEGDPPHPEISPGDANHPEVFTLWLFAFNEPSLCTEDACDADDLGETPAMGGVFQVDALLGDADTLEFAGNVRAGQPPVTGHTLVNPLTAEVHVAIAPHGAGHEGAQLRRQLNGPVGSPIHWWSAVVEN